MIENYIDIFVIYLVVINLLAFILFGADKWRALRRLYRISEATLFLVAALGGSLGAWAGMYLFHHKTAHKKFVLGIPLILLVQIVIVFCFLI